MTQPTPLPLTEAVARLRCGQRFGQALRGYETVGSTNTQALAWAREGAPEGSVVVAEYQTKGRGRLGRTWAATRGLNLTLSVILRPTLAPDRLGLITLAACVAAAEAIEAFTTPISPHIKWPNDVLLSGRKCCGMLLESALTGQAAHSVILGIGLNVNQDHFPEALAGQATSLLLETGRLMPRPPLLAALLRHLEHHYDTLAIDGGQAVRTQYLARMPDQGQPVTLRLAEGAQTFHGRIAGIDEYGALCLQTDRGLRTFHAGEVTTRPRLGRASG